MEGWRDFSSSVNLIYFMSNFLSILFRSKFSDAVQIPNSLRTTRQDIVVYAVLFVPTVQRPVKIRSANQTVFNIDAIASNGMPTIRKRFFMVTPPISICRSRCGRVCLEELVKFFVRHYMLSQGCRLGLTSSRCLCIRL